GAVPLPRPKPELETSPAPPGPMQDLLEARNRVRARHCAEPLTWSSELEEAATAWARELRDAGCAFEHSRTRYGENLAAGTELSAERVVDLWYDEVELYDWNSPGFSMEAGHFTQVVWADTYQIGCGTSECGGMTLWVCNYYPAGNVQGRFESAVQ